MSFEHESTPVFSGRKAPAIERRLGRRPRPVFGTRRPWRRRIGIALYVAAFLLAVSALVATVSDIADDPVTPSPAERRDPHAEPPVDEPHGEVDPH